MDILTEVLNSSAEGLRSQPVLAAHAWTSMASLEVLAQLESELGIVLDLRSFHEVRTVDGLIDLTWTVVTGGAGAAREEQRQ